MAILRPRLRTPRPGAAVALLLLAVLAAAPAPGAAPAPALSRHGMVASPHPEATLAGVRMLEAGGNAVDAAVATAFALGVVQPQSTGIGGGAFALLRLADGRSFALDARETAPAAATPEIYQRPGLPPYPSLLGGLAVGTPGMVAGLALLQERWGTLPLERVMAPAIALADEGYAVGPHQAAFMERIAAPGGASGFAAVLAGSLERFRETARIHFPEPPVSPRHRLRQPELAATLRAIARHGPRAFYEGPVAEAIAKAVAEHGGVLTPEDLAGYAPVVREPVRGRYRGLEVLSFPPPSSGGIALVQMLQILEGFDLAALGVGSSAAIHRIAEAMKLAFADRAAHLGDPDFVDVPVARLLDPAYAARLRARIDPPRWRRPPWTWGRDEVAIDVEAPGFVPDDRGTAHLSVTDAAGGAVALTGTINAPYGSLVTVPGTGILLNNEMDDFVTDPDAPNLYGLVGVTDANLVAPGKRPLSSMTPAIVVADGRPALVLGSNGGPRIITSVLQALVHVVDFDLDLVEAVSRPRVHHQWRPDTLLVEAAHAPDVVEALRRRGHEVEVVGELTTGVEAVGLGDDGLHRGATDPRRDGLALGPEPEVTQGGLPLRLLDPRPRPLGAGR